MENKLTIYNTLSRQKELFVPLHAPHVGMYVCGPTVYGDAHLGHARPAITFDILLRYLTHLGYKVRYVRNITDVGHLEHDADEGEDKIAKKARLEQLEPMEVVQYYLNRYHKAMEAIVFFICLLYDKYGSLYISMIVAECLFYVIAFFICIFSYKKKIRQISDRIDKSRSA